MRQSTAILSGTAVRLWELRFPAEQVVVHRTRLPYIHVENLLNFAKIDRDGRVDAYLAAYLPDEVALVFFQKGEAVNAVALTARDRTTIPIAGALQLMRKEAERGELVFCQAPFEQLIWMYHAGLAPLPEILIDQGAPEKVFEGLLRDGFTGVLEFIVDGRVSYIRFAQGRFAAGYFADKPADTPISTWIEQLLQPRPDGSRPVVAAGTYEPGAGIPEQASPALLEAAREVFWQLAERAEQEAPQDGLKRALRLRDQVATTHPPLASVSVARDQPLSASVMTPSQVTTGLAMWTRQLLEQLEVVMPGAAPEVLKTATRDHRFLLQRGGFYEHLPWTVNW
jgi:hypothetical protein